MTKTKVVQVSAIDMTQVKLLNELNKASMDNGFEVHCVSSSGEYVREILDEGFIFHPINIDRKINPIRNIISLVNMYKLFKRLKPEIVHVHTPIAAVLGRIASKMAGVPNIIYTAHGFYFHDQMDSKAYKVFYNVEKYMGRFFTDYIFFQSEEDYNLAVKNHFLKESSNYLHISNGINLDHKYNYNEISEEAISNLKNKHNIKDNDLVISFIGRLVEEKGIFDLLNAIDKLDDYNLKFIIMGSLPKSERDQYSYSKIQQYMDRENIIFTGQVDNAEEYLYLSDVFCLPSYREGMPRSIIEAMSMKNAIIATDIRGSREEVVNGETGFIIDLNSSEQIAEKIKYLNSNEELLNNMKEASYLRSQKLYDEKEVIKKQLAVFDRIRNE
ncbi:glycosyltransferase family 4 protein [Nosocomiicoccus sp. HMSC09A07]|uniref:glycosyltransferase family 4 protein n=1 Tax=Nosocomiicoccus sp. HMSC09A07 TaxID=1581145 RepID=UPI000A510950|nr:glycosyltransferase family 4 protein [Nosocomiicoccus sp. HMSC09A07]